MEKTAADVKAEIARLEQKLASMSQPANPKVAHEMSASRKLLAEIDDMEEQIAKMCATDDDDEDDEDDADEADEAVTASESAPGIEDEITQDKFHEVEDVAKTTETSGPSMLSVAPTGYTARLAQASDRLDKVASYLEKNGQMKLAFRIDKIADAIDTQLKSEAK